LVVVGGGPSGLAAAIRFAQLAAASGDEFTVCLVEKGSEIGAHILSGAVIETRALDELMPDWKEKGAPLNNPVTADEMHYLLNDTASVRLPGFLVPPAVHNKGNYAASLGNLCRWLGEQAEALGVMLFPGFAASEILFDESGAIVGVATGDQGISAGGEQKPSFQPGYELRAKYTVFAEGCRGHLGKQLTERFKLQEGADTQHYGIGFKEIWEIDQAKHVPGKVVHTVGWPLGHLPGQALGGSYLYHMENNQVAVGLIIDLGYRNPHLSPFDEFQRFKHHKLIESTLAGGKRLAYGARAVVKGGLAALPKLTMPGGLLTGDNAGFLNNLKQKGSHTAMKSGMLAGEAVFEAVKGGSTGGEELDGYVAAFKSSWLHKELYTARNTTQWWHRFGFFIGSALIWVDQVLFRGRLPFTLADSKADHEGMQQADKAKRFD
ncbi:MAG: NAD(P)/FAD-dependent oxidoreductase, partial [Pseudomonadales bacterium]